jgi:dTDP-N-acetylfucosamine:lipid II N-acetylfucosaminyltransferase
MAAGAASPVMATGPRVLHVMLDTAFCADALAMFEQALPGGNAVVVVGVNGPLRHLTAIEPRRVTRGELVGAAFLRELPGFRLVVVHYMDETRMRMTMRAPPGTRIVWLGWGGDYYPLLRYALREPGTARVARRLRRTNRLTAAGILAALKTLAVRLSVLDVHLRPRRLFRRVSHFAPVLREDYDLARRQIGGDFPPYLAWSYCNLEDHLLPDPEQRASGPGVLVGNSATWENNHLEIFDALAGRLPADTRLITPLSYGDPVCREHILAEGARRFGEAFHPLVKLMDAASYRNLVATCGVAVMNHRRQQGLGTVLIMLALGARVILNPASPVLTALRGLGVELFTTDRIAEDGLAPLSAETRARNLAVVASHWGRDKVRARTEAFLRAAAPGLLPETGSKP